MPFSTRRAPRPGPSARRRAPLVCAAVIGVLAAAAACVADGQAAVAEAPRPRETTELRGVWVSNVDSEVMNSMAAMESLAARIAALDMNALYPVVWSQGETFYPSAVMERYGAPRISRRYGLGDSDRDPMADWVALGRRHGLAITPWFEWGLKVPADSPLARAHPEWLSRDDAGTTAFDQDGTAAAYLNFVHPDVQRFYEDLAVEFVTRYDVPAIQFDDHLSLKNVFGYDDFTLALHAKETGRTARPAPDAPEWLAWRARKLTDFVARISRAIKRARPGVRLSVSPNPYPWSYNNYVQDWPSWVESGIVDEIVVQVYRDDMARFEGELRSPVLAALKGKARLAIGVMAGQRPAPVPIGMVGDQTALVRDCGFDGVVYFFQESLLNFTAPGETVESRCAAIKEWFPAPARAP